LNSKYTVISIKADYPNDAKLDFRVQALIGYYVAYGRSVVIFGYDFYGQESDWSNIQTIAIGETSSTSPNPTPTVPEFPILAILPLFAVIPLITTLFLRKKHI